MLLRDVRCQVFLAVVHRFNFSDIPLGDRLFGTYRDAIEFMPRCGFPDGAEQTLPEMLRFRDVYESDHR